MHDIFVLLASSLYNFLFFLFLSVIIVILLIASLVPRLIPIFDSDSCRDVSADVVLMRMRGAMTFMTLNFVLAIGERRWCWSDL